MDISFATRSQFLDTCKAARRKRGAELDAGGVVRVALREGGYDGRVIVIIRLSDCTSFGAEWESANPTRFLARIKAVATALLN